MWPLIVLQLVLRFDSGRPSDAPVWHAVSVLVGGTGSLGDGHSSQREDRDKKKGSNGHACLGPAPVGVRLLVRWNPAVPRGPTVKSTQAGGGSRGRPLRQAVSRRKKNGT